MKYKIVCVDNEVVTFDVPAGCPLERTLGHIKRLLGIDPASALNAVLGMFTARVVASEIDPAIADKMVFSFWVGVLYTQDSEVA